MPCGIVQWKVPGKVSRDDSKHKKAALAEQLQLSDIIESLWC